MRLQGKFLLPTIAMVIVGMAISTIIAFSNSSRALEDAAGSHILQIVDSTESLVTLWMERNRIDLSNWSRQEIFKRALSDTFMGNAARKSADSLMADKLQQYGFYEAILLADKNGAIIAGTDAAVKSVGSLGEQPYFTKALQGEIATSEVTKSASTGKPVFAIAVPVSGSGGAESGVMLSVINLEAFSDQHVRPIKVGQTGYAYIVDHKGVVIAHPDKTQVLKKNITSSGLGKNIFAQAKSSFQFSHDNVDSLVAHEVVPSLGWHIIAVVPVQEAFAAATNLRTILMLLAFAVALFLGGGLWALMNKFVIRPINNVGFFAERLQAGDLDARLPAGTDEIGQMGAALNAVVEELNAKTVVAMAISEGDLTKQVTISSDKDKLSRALDMMLSSLNDVTRKIMAVAQQVDAGSGMISDLGQSLSQGATEQASSLEEISSSISEIAAQIKTNAENAAQAHRLSTTARNAAVQGAEQVEEMMAAMKAITASSGEIKKIIKTIDEIAFQTNLLSLNAAVEAARAGRHGKGFAVVAQEVRALATRSAKAAQETTGLIEDAVHTIQGGNTVAEKNRTSLADINESVTKVADLIGEIAAASNEQAQGIAQVSQGLSQVDGVTHQHTANAEEMSSTAVELSSQASLLKSLLLFFKTRMGSGELEDAGGENSPQRQLPVGSLSADIKTMHK